MTSPQLSAITFNQAVSLNVKNLVNGANTHAATIIAEKALKKGCSKAKAMSLAVKAAKVTKIY